MHLGDDLSIRRVDGCESFATDGIYPFIVDENLKIESRGFRVK